VVHNGCPNLVLGRWVVAGRLAGMGSGTNGGAGIGAAGSGPGRVGDGTQD
jgi:hypothetical protein